MYKLSFDNIFIPRKLNKIEEEEKQKIQLLLQREVIDGDLDLSENKFIKDLGNVKIVNGCLNLHKSSVQSLSNLRYVERFLELGKSAIQSLGNLEYVGGSLWLNNTSIRSLNNLGYVGRDLDLRNTQIQDLGNLKHVGGNLFLYNTPLLKQFSNKQELEQYIRSKVEVKGDIYA